MTISSVLKVVQEMTMTLLTMERNRCGLTRMELCTSTIQGQIILSMFKINIIEVAYCIIANLVSPICQMSSMHEMSSVLL